MMSPAVLTLLILSTQDVPHPAEPAPSEWTAEEKADPVGAARHRIEQRETAGSLDRAAVLLDWRKGHGPESAEVLALLSQVHYRIGELPNPGKAEDRRRLRLARENGLKEARDAIRLEPGRADAHYWLGCLLLQTADVEQSYSRLKEALPEFREAQRLDPKVDEGGPARMLGRIYQETPGWPLLGSRAEAIRWFTKSLEAAPEAIQTHLWLGQTCAKDGQVQRARAELEKVTAARPRPGHEKELAESKQEAEAVLKTLPP